MLNIFSTGVHKKYLETIVLSCYLNNLSQGIFGTPQLYICQCLFTLLHIYIKKNTTKKEKKQEINIDTLLSLDFIQILPFVPVMFLIAKGSGIEPLAVFSFHVSLVFNLDSPLVIFLTLTLPLLKIVGQLFCKMSLTLHFSELFLWLDSFCASLIKITQM